MVEVQGKGSSSNIEPAGFEGAFSGEHLGCQTQYPPKEPQPLTCPQCGSQRIFKDGFRDSPLIAKSNELSNVTDVQIVGIDLANIFPNNHLKRN